MKLHSTNIWLLLGLLMIFSMRLWAQGQAYEPAGWLILDNESTLEHKVVESIENLKRAEANLDDSLTIAWLDSIGYLAITQSGFIGNASDENQRKGYWLLNYPVAIKYGLIINSTVDERMDLEKSTRAAFRYRNDLIKQYESLGMADLAFVEGPAVISKFLKDSISFPDRYKAVVLNNERLQNIRELFVKNKDMHPVGPGMPLKKVTTSQPISFEALHHYLQVPTSELKDLNPKWVADVFDPSLGTLFIPASVSETFTSRMADMEQKTRDDKILIAAANEKRIKALKGNIPDLNTYKPVSYKVKMGDNLGRIAQRYHVRISDLRAWNGLRSDRIYAGQRMTIYVSKNESIPVAPAPATKQPAPKPLFSGEFSEYTVKQGDTLWGISQKYEDVSIENIMRDNGIGENISPGQVLKIRKK